MGAPPLPLGTYWALGKERVRARVNRLGMGKGDSWRAIIGPLSGGHHSQRHPVGIDRPLIGGHDSQLADTLPVGVRVERHRALERLEALDDDLDGLVLGCHGERLLVVLGGGFGLQHGRPHTYLRDTRACTRARTP